MRQARGMTIEDLAHDANMHFTHLSGIERGCANPSLNKLIGLAAALGEPLSAIIADSENDLRAAPALEPEPS
jgi:transcriptional regulator with XRE-family HTH domain